MVGLVRVLAVAVVLLASYELGGWWAVALAFCWMFLEATDDR